MKNADYWRGRFSVLEEAAHKQTDKYLQSLEDIYREAEQTVQKDIESWYQRFATNNNVTLAEARKMLTTGQLEEFKWTAEQYVKAAQKANLSEEWIKKLENASTRFHVSRLEAIQFQIQQQIELLYGNQVDGIDDLLKDVISNGYTRGAFEIQKGIGLGWDFTALNQKKLETLLSKPWTTDGKTFRDRCWTNKAELVDTVNKELIQGMLRGDPPSKIITAIQKKFGTSRYKARRLVHTETTYFNAVSKTQMYKDLGVEQIEIVETLDSRTCPICQPLDGKVIPLSQYEPGVTVPPFHPNCRGTTCPYYDDMEGERAARNADGEVYYVPANMTFTQWKKAFVDGVKDGLTVATVGAIMKTVDECTTVEEVEALMKEQGWFYQTTLPDGSPFDGNQLLSLQGCDVDTAKAIFKAHENVFNRLPELRGQLNCINARKLSAGTYAQCSYGLGRGGISVNTSYFSDVERLTKLYANDLAHGFHPAGTTYGSIVTHELGHAVDDYLSVIHQLAGLNGWRAKKVSAYLRPKVMKACGLKVSDTRTAVSGYATQDAQEWFAECFCEWMDSENPRPVAVEFGKQLLELMKGMK